MNTKFFVRNRITLGRRKATVCVCASLSAALALAATGVSAQASDFHPNKTIATQEDSAFLQDAFTPSSLTLPKGAEADVVNEIDRAISHVGAENASANEDVDLPANGDLPAYIEGEEGIIEIIAPGTGEGINLANRKMFDGAAADTSVIFDSTEMGLRAIVHIDSPKAPERFELRWGE